MENNNINNNMSDNNNNMNNNTGDNNNNMDLTPEQYVVRRLLQAEATIRELKNKLEQVKPQGTQIIELSGQPNEYYSYHISDVYAYNRILMRAGKTPEFLEEALTDENKLQEFMKMSDPEWYGLHACDLECNLYNYKIDCKNGYQVLIVIKNDDVTAEKVGAGQKNFLNAEERDKAAKEELLQAIKRYLSCGYRDEFDSEANKKYSK